MGNELIKSSFGLSDRKPQQGVDAHGSASRTSDSQDADRLNVEIAVRLEFHIYGKGLAPYSAHMAVRIQVG